MLGPSSTRCTRRLLMLRKITAATWDLLRNIIPDHGVDHRTQFHVVEHVVPLTTGPKILSQSVNIISHRLDVLECVVVDFLHDSHHVGAQEYFIHRSVKRGIHSLRIQHQHVLDGVEQVVLQECRQGRSVETLIVRRGKCPDGQRDWHCGADIGHSH